MATNNSNSKKDSKQPKASKAKAVDKMDILLAELQKINGRIDALESVQTTKGTHDKEDLQSGKVSTSRSVLQSVNRDTQLVMAGIPRFTESKTEKGSTLRTFK